MFESFLKKSWLQSLFTGTTGSSGRTKFTFEELRALSDVLNKNQVVTEANRALVVETIRSIAEFMIWGDQNEPRIFDYFLENNIMHYLHRVLQQPSNRTGDVAKQVLQTLSIIIQNVRSETGTYFLFSNNHINNIVEIRFDFEDEEVLGYYISFLKTISLKLNARTVQFFFDRRESAFTFPLYSEAVKFAHHKEGMVRAGVRTLTLNVYSVPDEDIQNYVCRPPATAYFAEMVSYIADQVKILDKRMATAEGFNAQVLSSLDSQLAEVEDMVSYVADILSTAHPKLSHVVAEQLWVSLIGPYLLRPLLEYGSSGAVARSNSGARRTSAGGTAPASPGAAGPPSPVRTACSLYCLERLFVLITYPPLLNNLALALLDPRVGHPSCRSALMSVLRSEDHRPVPAALRCLVAVVHNRRIAPEVLSLLGMVPRSRSGDLQLAGAGGGDCAACLLDEQLAPLPGSCAAAGAPPDPLAEEAQPVATVASGPAASSATVFGYHVLWTRLEGASEWVLAQQGYGERIDRVDNSVAASQAGEAASAAATSSDQAEPGVQGSEAEADAQGEAAAGEPGVAAAGEQGLTGNHLGAEQGGAEAQPLLEHDAVEAGSDGPWPRPSMVDLLGLGDAAAPSDVRSSQPLSRTQTGQEADLLGFDSVLGTGLESMVRPGPPAPAPLAAPAQPGDGAGAPADAAGRASAAAAVATPATPPTAAGTGSGGQLADLLDLGAADVAVSAAPSSSTVLTPTTSVGAAPGPATTLAPTSSGGSLIDSLLEPSSSGPQPQQNPGASAQPAEVSHAPAPAAVEVEAPAAATTVVSDGAGVDMPPEVGPSTAPELEAGATTAAQGAAAAGPAAAAASPEPADWLGLLDVAPGPTAAAPLESAGASSALGSAGGDSSSAATTRTGAPTGALASALPLSGLDPSSLGSGLQATAVAAVAEADPGPSTADQVRLGTGVDGAVAAPPPPPPAPPAAPLPPPAAPAPMLAPSPVCAAHGRPAVAAGSSDLLDALFALLSMQLLPVQGLWHVGHLLQQLYPRAQEQRELDEQLQQLLLQQQQSTDAAAEPAVADLLNLDLNATGAEPAGSAEPATVTVAAPPESPAQQQSRQQQQQQQQPPSPPHPLDPSSTAGWACELSGSQREALRVAAVKAASAVLDEVGSMWCDALVAMLVLEWPLAHEAMTRPVLRAGAEQLMAGPHLYPRPSTRGLSGAVRNDQGLSGSAVAALHSYHAVSRLVALLLVHDLLCKGATERTPPATVPPPPGAEAEGREWDVAEGQEVELQAGSAIPCIVSFAPGQERRVYFAASGPALRRVSEYLQNPQALLSDPVAQAAVLHSSPAVVLAEPAPTRLNAGTVLSVSPLMGSDPSVDRNVAKWLHVHVRPSVRGLLRLLRSAAAGRKGGLLGALRHLVDGHWVLAFPDAERSASARQLVEESAHRLRALYCELLSPVLSTVME